MKKGRFLNDFEESPRLLGIIGRYRKCPNSRKEQCLPFPTITWSREASGDRNDRADTFQKSSLSLAFAEGLSRSEMCFPAAVSYIFSIFHSPSTRLILSQSLL
jgi:hypothetical protein